MNPSSVTLLIILINGPCSLIQRIVRTQYSDKLRAQSLTNFIGVAQWTYQSISEAATTLDFVLDISRYFYSTIVDVASSMFNYNNAVQVG